MIRARGFDNAARNLWRERTGAAAIEFGMVAPVMLLLMMGMGDLLYGFYANSILIGAVQKAGRDATLQINASTTATTAIDGKVMTSVKQIAPAATYVSTRQSYSSFANVDKPEPFTDKTGGTAGKYDVGIDCFTDLNGNNTYDTDGGKNGVGGASDVAQYGITITYPRIFPVAKLLGWGANGTLTATTLLKNQPYAAQTVSAVQVCP